MGTVAADSEDLVRVMVDSSASMKGIVALDMVDGDSFFFPKRKGKRERERGGSARQ